MNHKSFKILSNKKIGKFNKQINVESDKSLSIRSFLFGAISENISVVENVLESEDVFSTIKCLRKLGVKIIKKNKKFLVFGKGLGSLRAKKNTILDFGNSGTLARLLIGILSTNPNIELKLTGDKSLNKRSMRKLIDQMERFGAEFLPKKKFTFPLKILSSELPIGINFISNESAQIKSAVILAGLNSFGSTQILEKQKSRDHTENILLENPKCIKLFKNNNNLITIFGKKQLNPINLKIPGDPSSAAFFVALCILTNKSNLIIKDVQLNPTRTGFFEIIKKHGAKINFLNKRKRNNEIIGDIKVSSSKLKKFNVNKKYYVSATDEYPIMFVLAALTNGISIFKGISELKNKESDRIKEMQKILKQIGVKSIFKGSDLKIFGKTNLNKSNKSIIKVSSILDHRICMSALILSQVSGIRSSIDNFETVRTSSPNFLRILKQLGGKFEIKKKS